MGGGEPDAVLLLPEASQQQRRQEQGRNQAYVKNKAATKPMYKTRQEMGLQWEKEWGNPTKAEWFSKSGQLEF